jgi:FKBP-type peptidyl-prolyl cis-trans isomerase
MRKLPVIFAATALALVLGGCASAAPTPTDTAAPAALGATGTCSETASGSASDGVTVSGDQNAKPTATFATPLSVTDTQRTIVTPGSGEKINIGDSTTMNLTAFNGTTGAEVYSSVDQGGAANVTVDSAFIIGIVKGVECAPGGSRIVAVIPPADAWGDKIPTGFDLTATDSVVLVLDVGQASPPAATPAPGSVPSKATGADQPATAGFPTVVLAADGAPTMTIPGNAPPTTLDIAVLKKGDGATVPAGATVTVQYQGVIWGTGAVFDQSWGKAPAQFSVDGVIAGFKAALVGQTVGSQVIVIIPPDQGYGASGVPAAGIAATDTLVFVVDILATS